ncbi:MAG: hypothetical protein MK085_10845, partial [Phycisphaerales bacterium]|nr:hypothetical protein [Phycisphaerales bacterium]
GRVDGHLADAPSPQVVKIQSNTIVVEPSLLDTPNLLNSMKVDVRKLENSQVFIENNIYAAGNAPVNDGYQWPHSRSHNGAYGIEPSYREAWGATDLPDVAGIVEVFDFYTLQPVGAYASGASDGGPLGIRWSSVPTWSELNEISPNWFETHQVLGVPISSTWSVVFADEDLR